MKNKIIVFLILIVMVFFVGCKSGDIEITAGEDKITFDLLEDFSSNNIDQDIFKNTFETKEIKYINIDDKIYIDFNDNYPDKFDIKDYLLDESGNIQYSQREVAEIPVTGENDLYYFEVRKHYAAALSSKINEDNKVYRGIKIITETNGVESIYIFVIQTDGI